MKKSLTERLHEACEHCYADMDLVEIKVSTISQVVENWLKDELKIEEKGLRNPKHIKDMFRQLKGAIYEVE